MFWLFFQNLGHILIRGIAVATADRLIDKHFKKLTLTENGEQGRQFFIRGKSLIKPVNIPGDRIAVYSHKHIPCFQPQIAPVRQTANRFNRDKGRAFIGLFGLAVCGGVCGAVFSH